MPIDLGVTRRRRSSGGSSTPAAATAAGAQLVERPGPGTDVGARPASERGGLQVGQEVGEPVGAEGGDRRGERPVRADDQGGADEEPGLVGAHVALVGRPAGGVEVGQRGGAVEPDDHPAAVDPPVGDPGAVQRDDRPPHAREQRRRPARRRRARRSVARGLVVTSRASPWSATPTATTSSVGTPACDASSVKRASCSTRDRRVPQICARSPRRVRAVHSDPTSWLSHASRP